jgi:hypothetical protein
MATARLRQICSGRSYPVAPAENAEYRSVLFSGFSHDTRVRRIHVAAV